MSDSVALDHAVNKIAHEPSVEMGPEATEKSYDTSRHGLEHLDHPAPRNSEPPKSWWQKGLEQVGSMAKDLIPKVLPELLTLL
jgi:hypothetical protein